MVIADSGARFFTELGDLDAVTKALRHAGWSVTTSEMGYIAKESLAVTPEQRADVEEFLEAIQSTRRLPRRQRGHRQRRRASRACDPQPSSSSREETRLRKIGKLTDQDDIDQDALDSSTHQTLGAAAVQGRIAL